MAIKANSEKKYSVILFLIWPFLALIYAAKNYKASWSKNIIWFFVIFYGFTLTIHNVGEEISDANRYRDKFIEMAGKETTGQIFLAIAFRSAEVNAVNQMELQGSRPENIVLTPMLTMWDLYEESDNLEAAQTKNWWEFWK